MDMQKERDYLLKNTFLKLKALCAQRSVTFKEIDLRWGITEEESRQGKVLPICLEEINQCRPYFIGLLGERYGWIPDEIPKEVFEQEKWVKKHRKKSVTELEILHGVMNNSDMAEHAFFYFRDPKYLNTIPEDEQEFFAEIPSKKDISNLGLKKATKQSEGKKRLLKDLKEKIRNSGFNVQENYLTPEKLGQLVEKDLTRIINEQFPEDEKGISEHALENNAQQAFCSQKSELYIGGHSYFKQLNQNILSNTHGIIVSGDSGVGKSAFLATWAHRYSSEHPDALVLNHFIGASRNSTDYKQILKRFIIELSDKFNLSTNLPEDLKNIHLVFTKVLKKIPNEKRIILIIDALNQLDDEGYSNHLFWMPESFPENITIITSCIPGEIEETLKQKKFVSIPIHPLENEKQCQQFIVDYLKLYRKKLDRKNQKKILKKPQAYLPIYLKTLLEEIRMYGDHTTLGKQIEFYLEAQTPVSLFKRVLSRYEKDYEKEHPNLIQKAFSYIWVSRRGLMESELLQLMGKNETTPLPQFYWTRIFLAAQNSLVIRSGYINFSHTYFTKAVKEKYLLNKDIKRQAHQTLSQFFDQQSSGNRRIEELPWQLMQSEQWKKLANLFKDLSFFEQAFSFNEFDVYRYWTKIKANSDLDLKQCFQNVLAKPTAYKPYLHKLARLFNNLGHSNDAVIFHDTLMRVARKDRKVESLIPSLIEKANILKKKNDFKNAALELEHAERLCRNLNDEDNLQRVLGNQADIHTVLVETDKALVKVDEALSVAERLENKYVIQHLLAIKSAVYDTAGNFDKALYLSREAQKLCEEIGEDAALLSLLLDQATILKKKSDFPQAYLLYNKCIDEAKELGNDQVVAKSLIGQSDVLVLQGKSDRALNNIHKALSICDTLSDTQNKAEALIKKADIMQVQGQFDSALDDLDVAEELFIANGSKKDLISCYNTKSVIYNAQQKYELSLPLLEKAESLCRELNMKDALQGVIGNKAMIFRAYKRFDEALELYREKEQICRKTGNKKSLAICLGNMGNIFHELQEYDRAIELNKQKAEIAYEIGNLKSYANAVGNQAGILLETKQYDKALGMLKEQEKICSDLNDIQGLCQSLTNKTLVLYNLDEFSDSLENCKKALNLVNKYNFSPSTKRFLEKMKMDINKQL